jgi:hypothetical protein
MHFRVRITISWVPYPALFVSADCGLGTSHAPSARRMAHGPHHGLPAVGHSVGDGMGHAVGRKSSPRCSFWAAGARPIRIPARAQALMLRNDAAGLRALGLKPASLLRNAPASLPVPRSHRAPADQGQKQNPSGGDLRTGLRALGQESSPKTPASAPAPDWRPIPSLRSVIPRPPVVRASRLTKHRISRVWERSFRCRSLGLAPACAVSGSVSAGALPLPLRRLGAAYHGSPALGGLRKLSLWEAKSFCRCLQSIDNRRILARFGTVQTSLPISGWAASARPFKPQPSSKLRSNCNSIIFNAPPKPK